MIIRYKWNEASLLIMVGNGVGISLMEKEEMSLMEKEEMSLMEKIK